MNTSRKLKPSLIHELVVIFFFIQAQVTADVPTPSDGFSSVFAHEQRQQSLPPLRIVSIPDLPIPSWVGVHHTIQALLHRLQRRPQHPQLHASLCLCSRNWSRAITRTSTIYTLGQVEDCDGVRLFLHNGGLLLHNGGFYLN